MTKHKKTRFAVAGCGVISEMHFQGIAQTEEAELAAVCDIRPEKAQQAAAQYGVPYFTDYELLLRQENIDVVNICTPSGMHPEQTVMAAEAGKHVVVEKPMAIRLEDVRNMIRVCDERNVRLTTIFPRRMAPAARFAKQLIADGKLGKLSLCTAIIKPYRDQAYYDSAGWRGTWAMDGGGVLMNQGIHTVDLLQWLAGPVASLQARTDHVLRSIEVEDTATALLTFKNGALGLIEATTTAYKQPPHQIVIHGECGTLVLTGDEITTLEVLGEQVDIPAFEPFQVLPDGHRMQIKDMALAVIEGRHPQVTGQDGLHSLEIILGAYASSRSGNIQHL